jgi:hypothetical protein
MTPEEMKQVWQSQEVSRRSIPMDVVLSQVRRNQQSFNTIIWLRDVREIGVAIVLIPIWIVMGIKMALPWTWYLAIPGILFVAGFMIVDRRRRKPTVSPADESLIATTERSLAEVDHQIWLLRNVLWWYILPLSAPSLPFFIHVGWIVVSASMKSGSPFWFSVLGAVIAMVPIVLIFVAIEVFVYSLNHRAVRNELEPRRRELEELLASLRDEP